MDTLALNQQTPEAADVRTRRSTALRPGDAQRQLVTRRDHPRTADPPTAT